jgi:hypothetical protein
MEHAMNSEQIPAALTGHCPNCQQPSPVVEPPKRPSLQDTLSEIWAWCIEREIVELMFAFHPVNACHCAAAYLENLIASGFDPEPDEVLN